ncbi:MAG: M23 family metallopeptidase [Mariniphaga sp.]|nr:M23 family metallopeptidase [Mariniphaga sp.]
MPGKYYKFDVKTLKYKSDNPSLKKRLHSFLKFFSIILAISTLFVTVFIYFYGSPGLKHLQNKNAELISKYEALEETFSRIDSSLKEISIKDDNLYRIILDVQAISPSVREGGFGGSDKYRQLENMENSELVISAAKELDILLKKSSIQLNSYNEVLLEAQVKEKMHNALPAISPLPENKIGYISDYFGYRMHPIHKKRLYHWGVDLTADIGTKIYAPGDGIVEQLNYASSGYGKMLLIDHGFGFKTLYGHLSKYNVKKEDSIKRGDVIAFVGNAGTSSGSHLHYEIIKDGKKLNPLNYFTTEMNPEEYFSIISK